MGAASGARVVNKRNGTQLVLPSNDEIVEGTCDLVSSCGSLAQAARQYGLSPRGLWHIINSNAEYGEKYARARAARAQAHEARIARAASTLKTIASTNLDDDIKIKALTAEVKTRQWLAKVSDPHMFGDRQILEGGNKPIGLEHSTSPNEHARRIAFALLAAAVQPGAK